MHNVIIIKEMSNDSSQVFPFLPNQNPLEELKLESNTLIHQRMQEKYFKNMSIKHKAQYKKIKVELNLKEIELKDLEQRKAFCGLQYSSLREQHFALMKKSIGSTLHPHP